MSTGELLLELLSEEIPAGMQRRAIEALVQHLGERLQAHRIPAGERIRGFVTPRRLAVIANGIPHQQPDRKEERRGPRVGAPQNAIDGFLHSVGLKSIAQCEVRKTERGEFYFATIERGGSASVAVLPDLILSAIVGLEWPKSMRFPSWGRRWVRPLASVICLFDGEVLPLALDRVPVGRTTRGHRFLSDGVIEVAGAADYLAKLEAAHVILDQDRRRELIGAGLDRLAEAAGLRVKPDPGLLDEVTGLVEFPVVLMGQIEDEFVRPIPQGLPSEVLTTAMRTHQKYFTCLRDDGSPAPRFLLVANNRTPDQGAAVIAGNERVLRARLADARFFWDQDRRIRLEDRVAALQDRIYYDKLGTMLDKAARIERLAGFLAARLGEQFAGSAAELASLAQRAARLAKADLSTGMVGEFPELQGVMGRYYALHDDEDPRVADAIADHYKPLGPNDTCPTAPVSVIVALADKIDALAAFFSIGEKPTGSRDPFALRRAAQGVIRLILENRLRLKLRDVFEECELYAAAAQIEGSRNAGWPKTLVGDLHEFIAERVIVHLRDRGVRHDLVTAIFRLQEDDLVRLLARIEPLFEFLASVEGADLLIAYRRAANIVAIESRAGRWTQGDIDEARMAPEERALAARLHEVRRRVTTALDRDDFGEAMAALATLRRPIDEFFNKVTVNAEDPALRENRLRLLSRIRAVMNQVADFSQIEG